jgi:hypothetical protein
VKEKVFDVNASDLLGDPSPKDFAKLPLEQTAGGRDVAQQIVHADWPVARGTDPAQGRGDICLQNPRCRRTANNGTDPVYNEAARPSIGQLKGEIAAAVVLPAFVRLRAETKRAAPARAQMAMVVGSGTVDTEGSRT